MALESKDPEGNGVMPLEEETPPWFWLTSRIPQGVKENTVFKTVFWVRARHPPPLLRARARSAPVRPPPHSVSAWLGACSTAQSHTHKADPTP